MKRGLAVALGLAARLLLLVRRSPSLFVPSLVIPLFILVSTAGAFRGVENLPQLQGASYLAFTVPMAATLGAGFAGVGPTAILYLLPLLFSGAAAFWATGVALRTRTIQSAPIMQIAVFLSVFLSVAYTPREAQTGWLAGVADYNPMTFVLEAARGAELTGVRWDDLWPGLASLAGMLAVLGVWAFRGLGQLDRD